ncbi:hypothetical protein PFL02_51920 [Pseudomonas fluorescens]|uniref:hypothetical protein n=1 Tax=Pseudomonas protegens TaxID=380021 RepID=UPI00098D43C2|nr:hypothetical protein [Pseudomonas protegens]GED78342.1 hypothetical protein PFL02_51920 [Pseudomonas fluorescens]
MFFTKEEKVEGLRKAIPTPPATGDQLKDLAAAVKKTLAGTPIESRTDEILAKYVQNQAKTGHYFDQEDAGYLNRVADYIESSISDDFSDLNEKTFDWYVI